MDSSTIGVEVAAWMGGLAAAGVAFLKIVSTFRGEQAVSSASLSMNEVIHNLRDEIKRLTEQNQILVDTVEKLRLELHQTSMESMKLKETLIHMENRLNAALRPQPVV